MCVGVLQVCESTLCSNTSCPKDEVTQTPALVVFSVTTATLDATVPKTGPVGSDAVLRS